MTNTRLAAGMRIRTGAVVDCTGNAGIARLLGIDLLDMPMTCPGLGFALHGVKRELLAPGAMDVTRALFRAVEECSIQLFPDITFNVSGKPAMPGMLNLPPDSQKFHFTELTKLAEKRLKQSLDFLRAHLPAMKHAIIAWKGSEAGYRSGPVIAGRERLDLKHDDITDSLHIAGRWPAEQWYDVRGARFTYPAGGAFIIPDGCITVDFHIPFFTAGRCISATAAAQSAVRVVGTCLETGCRAGFLAARAARRGYHELMIRNNF